MRTKVAAAALTAALVTGGAVGAMVFVPGAANAAGSATSAVAPTWVTDTLNKLVNDGTINQQQADAVSQALAAAEPAHGDGDHHGPGGPGGPGMGLSAAATAIGISEADLRTALESGQTLAQIAAAHGVSAQTVIDALVADAKTHLDAQVTSGAITQAEADQRKADVVARITDMVNNGRPAAGHWPKGGPGRPHDGDADDQGTTTTTTS